MKTIAAGVLCAALSGCAAWGGEKTDAQGWTYFSAAAKATDKKNGYEITFPEGWRFWIDPARMTFGRPDRALSGSVYVYALKDDEGLRSFFDTERAKALLLNFDLTDLKLCRVCGRNAFKLEVIDKHGPTGLKMSVYYVVAGGRGYALWFSALYPYFDTSAKDIDAIVTSFKLLKTE
jgi:hypothetical protein